MAAALAAQREKLKAKKARKVEPKEDEYGPIVDKPVSEMSFAEAIAYKKRMRDQKAKQEAEKAAQAAVQQQEEQKKEEEKPKALSLADVMAKANNIEVEESKVVTNDETKDQLNLSAISAKQSAAD